MRLKLQYSRIIAEIAGPSSKAQIPAVPINHLYPVELYLTFIPAEIPLRTADQRVSCFSRIPRLKYPLAGGCIGREVQLHDPGEGEK